MAKILQRKTLFILIGALILLSACAKPPVDEMNRAIDALNRAENDYDAVTYAQNTLNRAREALVMMQEEADSKRFDSAKTYAADVVNYAERAMSEGRANGSRAREEAASLLESLRTPLAETESALNTARANNANLDFNALGNSLDSANLNYRNARQSLEANNFADAISRGQSVRLTLDEINANMRIAAQDLSSKL